MADNRVALVTGASGFVGSHLVAGLVRDSWTVHAILRKESRLPLWLPALQVESHIHDGTVEGMVDIVASVRPSTVFHVAAMVVAEHGSEQVTPLIESNLHFGTQLLEAMRSLGCRRLINTGTTWQHYDSAAYNPVNLYAATKQAFEDIVRYYVEAHDFVVTTLELSDSYGANDPRNKLLAALRRAAIEGDTIDLSPGEQIIDLVHVDDVVAAYLMAALGPVPAIGGCHERYSVHSGEVVSLRQLVGLVEEIVKAPIKARWGARPYRKREVMRPPVVAPPLPGWVPARTLKQGLREVLS